MATTDIGAGIELAQTLLSLIAPSVTQEQKESLLDAFKDRTSENQSVSDAIRANPADRAAQLAYGARLVAMCNAAGSTAGGLASINVAVPLDDLNAVLDLLNTLVLLVEQQQQSKS